ncbi:MAG: lytic transglycosylase domain-containing protein [Xanthobacteraceae bacterium]
MRAILVFAILLLGLSGAAPEPEYSLFRAGSRFHHDALDDLVQIESSTGRADRLSLASLGPRVLRVELLRPQDRGAQLRLASLSSELEDASVDNQVETPTVAPRQPTPLDNVCNTLFSSAQDNDLPVPFFANLLWQESRLRADDVSKKGAQGIAQFMPKTAVETGLANPFDPMQAIPASARFLQRLRMQFGNLGFVAAAYNAGAHRVIEWLERRASLPRETRDYVVRVTGLSVEAWKTTPVDNSAVTFVPRLPCRTLPAFANFEQEQAAANQQTPRPDVADQAAAPAQPPLESKHARVHVASRVERHSSKPTGKREAKREGSQIARQVQASKRDAKREGSQIAREAQASKHDAKHGATHLAREGHAVSKHEAAHSGRGRERHRSA